MDEDDRKPAAIESNNGIERSNSPSKEVKPALKKNRDKQTSDNKDRHLQWDEVAIEEHNELRGTRMNIDEPKTPYIYYDSGAESDDSRRVKSPANQRPTLSWDHLQSRLDSVAAVREQYPSSPSDHHGSADTDHSDAEDQTRNDMRKVEFREHRKRHYNEFELVKKFRAEQNMADDDEEEDDIDNAADDERETEGPK
jgi:protein phosphatase inhibitor 2